jgi:hypothetical protein
VLVIVAVFVVVVGFVLAVKIEDVEMEELLEVLLDVGVEDELAA